MTTAEVDRASEVSTLASWTYVLLDALDTEDDRWSNYDRESPMGTFERKTREYEARRELILRAAKATFAAKGQAAATIDDVAQRAEVAKGTIYRYFKSKEDLFHVLVEDGLARLARRFRAAIDPGLPADENLRRLTQAYLDFYREEPDYFWICYFGGARDAGRKPFPDGRHAHRRRRVHRPGRRGHWPRHRKRCLQCCARSHGSRSPHVVSQQRDHLRVRTGPGADQGDALPGRSVASHEH